MEMNNIEKTLSWIKNNSKLLIGILISVLFAKGLFNNQVLRIAIWPISIISVMLLFKEQIDLLLSRIKAVKVGNSSVLLGQNKHNKDDVETIVRDNEILRNIVESQGKSINEKNASYEQISHTLAIYEVYWQYELLYNNMDFSQINLLRDMVYTQGFEYSIELLDNYFQPYRAQYENYKNLTVTNFIEYLLNNLLISQESNSFKITDYGVAFVQYIDAMGHIKYPLI